MYPTPAADAAGNSLIVWVRYDGTDFPDFGLWARWFGPDGRARGDQFRITQPPTSFEGYPDAPSVAMRPDGAFVVTWIWRDDLGVASSLRARIFGSDGAPRSGEITVGSANFYRDDPHPRVAMDNAGNFVVLWTSVDPTRSNPVFWARMYDSVGTPKGSVFLEPTEPSARYPDVAMDANGNFVVVWWQIDVDSERPALFGRRYDSSDVASGDRFAVSTTSGSTDPGGPAVAMTQSGHFAVAFERSLPEQPSLGVFVRRFDASGAPVGGEFRVSAVGPALYRGGVDIDMDDDGDFVVAWWEQDTGGDWPKLHSRLYAASGRPLMPDRSYRWRLEWGDRVAMDAAGNFVATWAEYAGNPSTGLDQNVFVQHFAGPGDTRPGCAGVIAGIVGTVGNDSLRGTSGDDVLHGLGGNDILKGAGGADIICGGAGDDQLFGGSRWDHLLGGPGDDVLDGGDGNDRCNGNGQTNADTALACETVLQVP
jgi:hypothetical protein